MKTKKSKPNRIMRSPRARTLRMISRNAIIKREGFKPIKS